MREPAELGTPSTQKRALTATGGSSPGSSGASSATPRKAPRSAPPARPRQNSNTSAPETSPERISSACWAAVRCRRSLTPGRSRAARAGHAKATVGDVGCAGKRLLVRQAGPRLVLAQDVLELDDVRRRLDPIQVQLVHLLHVAEDLGQLARHPLELRLGEPQAREARDVEHLVAVDHGPRL